VAIHDTFDWTFTTTYKGTTNREGQVTDKEIDYARLSRNDPIALFDHIVLYEDELSDHGLSTLDVRVRVMPQMGFFVLMRFFLRVDRVLVRIYETRVYHCFGAESVLVEHVQKEETCSSINKRKRGVDWSDVGILSGLVEVQSKEVREIRL
jgi:type 2A phosphatase activator TIP41